MRMLRVDDRVRLVDDVPETDLVRGRIGVICSQWKNDREPLFEVEFNLAECNDVRRLLLHPTQIVPDAAEELAVD